MYILAKIIKGMIKAKILYLAKKVTVYIDMDNTVALFCKKGEDKLSLERIYEKDFWENLEVMDNCQLSIPLMQMLGIRVVGLSACCDSQYCKIGKIEWVKNNLPSIDVEKNLILCNMGENKAQYAKDIQNSILIDDYGKNLLQWREAGGIAVKKSSSNKKRSIPVVRDHMDIFKVLFKLGYLKIRLLPRFKFAEENL